MLPRHTVSRWLIFAIDLGLCLTAVVTAYMLRFDFKRQTKVVLCICEERVRSTGTRLAATARQIEQRFCEARPKRSVFVGCELGL